MNNPIVLIKRTNDLAENSAAQAVTMLESCPPRGMTGGRLHLAQDTFPAVRNACRSSLSFVQLRYIPQKEVVLHFPL